MGGVDYIGVNVLFRHVNIGIFDDLDSADEPARFARIRRKIDRCTQFVRSGEMLANYPSVRGYRVVFELISTQPLTPAAAQFWTARERAIRASGFGVRLRHVDIRPSLGIAVPLASADAVDALSLELARAHAETEPEPTPPESEPVSVGLPLPLGLLRKSRSAIV
jgi:hypothetical protein